MEIPDFTPTDIVTDELALLNRLVPLHEQRIIEIGCGAAYLSRKLLAAYPACTVTGLEVDEAQHAKNLAAPPVPGLSFVAAGAQAIPFDDAAFDLAIMLKSLHHVPLDGMDQGLAEARRVLKPGGQLLIAVQGAPEPLCKVGELLGLCDGDDHVSPAQLLKSMEDAGLEDVSWRLAQPMVCLAMGWRRR